MRLRGQQRNHFSKNELFFLAIEILEAVAQLHELEVDDSGALTHEGLSLDSLFAHCSVDQNNEFFIERVKIGNPRVGALYRKHGLTKHPLTLPLRTLHSHYAREHKGASQRAGLPRSVCLAAIVLIPSLQTCSRLAWPWSSCAALRRAAKGWGPLRRMTISTPHKFGSSDSPKTECRQSWYK
jgi:hypothetical protein